MKIQRPAAMVVVVDFLVGLLLLQAAVLALSTIQRKVTPPSIVTLGIYAVVVTWPNDNPDDVDLYVEDPQDHIVYFANSTAGLMNLEHDNLGAIGETQEVGVRKVVNHHRNERVILRGVVPGEYVVNVHEFDKRTPAPTRVTVELVRLVGGAKVIVKKTVVLIKKGQEKTAFRFTLNDNGYVTRTSTDFKEVVYEGKKPENQSVAPPEQSGPPSQLPGGAYGPGGLQGFVR